MQESPSAWLSVTIEKVKAKKKEKSRGMHVSSRMVFSKALDYKGREEKERQRGGEKTNVKCK